MKFLIKVLKVTPVVLFLFLNIYSTAFAATQTEIISCNPGDNNYAGDKTCKDEVFPAVLQTPQPTTSETISFTPVINAQNYSPNISKDYNKGGPARLMGVTTQIFFPKGTRPKANYLLRVGADFDGNFGGGIGNNNRTDDFVDNHLGNVTGCAVVRYLSGDEISTRPNSVIGRFAQSDVKDSDSMVNTLKNVGGHFLLISVYSEGAYLPPIYQKRSDGEDFKVLDSQIVSGNKENDGGKHVNGYLSFWKAKDILHREFVSSSHIYTNQGIVNSLKPQSDDKRFFCIKEDDPNYNPELTGLTYKWSSPKSSTVYRSGEICKTLRFAKETINIGGIDVPNYRCVGCVPSFNSVDLFGSQVEGVDTGIGCLPSSLNGIVSALVRIGIGVAGGIAFLRIVYAFIMIMMNGSNPEVVKNSLSMITSAAIGLLVIVLSVFLLNLFGVQVLNLGDFGGQYIDSLTK